MAFEITVAPRPNSNGTMASVVKITGALDISSAPQADEVLTPLVASAPKVTVFDLAQLRFLDSTGIGLLLRTRGGLERNGGTVFITNMQPQIRKIFDIVKVLPASTVFQNMAEFDEYLKAIQEKVEDEGG